jgi:hypothetical protein
MRVKTSLGTAILATLIGVVATTPSEAAVSANDACSLLTSAQLGTVLGVSMGHGLYVNRSFSKTCTWAPSGGFPQGVRSVTLNLQTAEAYDAGKKILGEVKEMTKPGREDQQPSATPVSGLGDDAYFLSMSDIMSLIVKKGDASFKVVMYGGDFSMNEKHAMEKALAMRILSEL